MDTPNTTVIEMSAIVKLKDAILRTQQIEPDIRENDKTPSWDGELRVYRESSFDKKYLCGRVPVQVKGKWVNKLLSSSVKFDVELSDLENYRNDGGAMFFVIHIKDADTFKIYYRSLLPFDLRKLISQANGEKTTRIKLKQFPHRHKDGMLRILMDFITNRKKQGTLLPNVHSIMDLKDSGLNIEGFEFSIPQIGIESEEEMLDAMLASEPYLYVKFKDLQATFVVDKIQLNEIGQKWDDPITVDGEVLYNGFTIAKKAGGNKEIKLGNGITIEGSEDKPYFKFSLDGTISEQMRDLKLMCALMQKKDIFVGDQVVRYGDYEDNEHSLDEAIDRLAELQKIAETLKMLRVKKDLNMGKLTKSEFELLNQLVAGIHDNHPVAISLNGNPGFGKLTIGNVSVILSCKKDERSNGFIISNFFDSTSLMIVQPGAEPSEGVSVSPYVLLSADDFEVADNMDFSQITHSIKSFPYTTMYGAKITLFILELLKYYDSKETKEYNILDIVEELIDYLKENDAENEELYQINHLQTAKRRRALTKEEIEYLMTLKAPGIPKQYQVAANILLESFHEAKVLLEQLGDEERTAFQNYPIYNLLPKVNEKSF